MIVRTRSAASLEIASKHSPHLRAVCNARLSIVALGTDAVEELATSAEIEAQIEIVGSLCTPSQRQLCMPNRSRYLKVVVQRDDVFVPARHFLQHRNLVAYLWPSSSRRLPQYLNTHHELATLHELFVDDLACVVLAGLDVDGLLYDSVRAAAQRLAGTILDAPISAQRARNLGRARTWQGTVGVAGIMGKGPAGVVVVNW